LISKFTRGHWLIAATLFAAVCILGALRMAPGVVGVYHDDGIYIATAKAIAEGKGYRLIDLPGEPPQTKYPFLYPAILTLLWRLWPVFPDNLLLLQAFSLVCTASSIAIAFLYLVRFGYFSTAEAVSATVISATSPVVLYFATQTLSEPLFGLLLVCGLWCTEAALQSSTPIGRSTAVRYGVTIALSFLTRVVAAPVIAVASLLVLWRKRNVWLLIGAGSCASLWLLWIVTHSVESVPGDDIAAYYTIAPYIGWWSQGASNLINVPAQNCLSLLLSTITVPMPAFGPVGPHNLWIVPVLGVTTWWSVAMAWFDRPGLVTSLAAYVGLILLWPWPPGRFLVPLIPLLLVFLVRGINRTAMTLPRFARNSLLAVLVAAATLSNLAVLRADVVSTRRSGYPAYPRIKHDLPTWNHFEQLFRWVRQHSSANDVLASGLDSMLFLYTDRQAIRPFEPRPMAMFYGDSGQRVGSVEQFVRALRQHHVKFFVRLPMYNFAEEEPLDRLVTETMRKLPGCLKEAYSLSDDRRFGAYAVHAPLCSSERLLKSGH
jgi:hypothetical protein